MTAPYLLVVDHDVTTGMLTSRWLEDGGYRVEMLSGAHEAIEALEDRTPSVVVIDVQVPGDDGLWLAGQIRVLWPDTALVFTSGDPAAGPVVARAGIGAFDYLERPFTVAQLMEAVDRGTSWQRQHAADRRRKLVADATQAAPIWSYDADTKTLTQHADWLPSPVAVSRLVTDLLLARSGTGAQ
jgi:DNA-binding NtrC family response regulator